jgi:predicted DNA-binding transcriptional regulator YafY
VHSGPSGWYLSGREADGDVVKEFVVARMSDIALDAPGTAEVVAEPVRPSLDPLSWQVDPPVEVVLAVPAEHRVLAANLLGTPVSTAQSGRDLELTYLVTNRQVFRYRIYELGTRVTVLSPTEVRAEIVAELRSFLGEPA